MKFSMKSFIKYYLDRVTIFYSGFDHLINNDAADQNKFSIGSYRSVGFLIRWPIAQITFSNISPFRRQCHQAYHILKRDRCADNYRCLSIDFPQVGSQVYSIE